MEKVDIAVVGGGIVGLAVARDLINRNLGKVMVLEKEPRVGDHQSGHNSGVLHAGLYYKPGSLKAKTCRAGKRAMESFCQAENIPWERCGKVVVATHEAELSRLKTLAEKGRANGVELSEIDSQQIREIEPHAAGIAGLFVAETGIVDYRQVCDRLAQIIREQGGMVECRRGLQGVIEQGTTLRLQTSQGEIETASLINCAGLYSDQVYRMCGGTSTIRIVPFRGEYYELKPSSHHLVRNLIYPVPDPAFPFLGVHFTRMVAGGVECGPNAVLAMAREGYTWKHWNVRELMGTLCFSGFQKLAMKYYRMGAGEMWRSLNKGAFVKALQRLLPSLQSSDLMPGRAGVRAQAVGADGALIDDFLFERSAHAVHVLNAPSPAATASLAIAEHVVNTFLESSASVS